jgi:hypothetical protein
MENRKWNLFTEYVNKEFGVSCELLNYIAVEEILLCCATGLSNKTISNICNCKEKYIIEVLNEFFNFDGWEEDLDVNILHLYESSGKLIDSYEILIKMISSVYESIDIKKSYDICKKYEEIIKRINKYYE